jgi:lipoprotein-releasing system permease protein
LNIDFFIAKRYLFSKRKVTFITIISIISIIGVTIGVAAMILVLSVFNGFNKKVTNILVGFDPHLRIESVNQNSLLSGYESFSQKLRTAGIENFAPYTLNKGMLINDFTNKVLFIKGVDENISKVSGVKEVTRIGKFELKDKGDFGSIILGLSLADQLRVTPGDTLTLISPVGLEVSLTQFIEPITKKFIISGIYDSDNKEYDSRYAYISLENSNYLFKLNNTFSGIEIKLNNIIESDEIKDKLQNLLGKEYNVMTWYDLHKDFYSILKVERWAAFIILSIIIIVASFNILGSLTMTVIEKKRDIGILKAMGASDSVITKIFLFEGIVVGIIGMVSGTIISLVLAILQKEYGLYKINSAVFKMSTLPVELRFTDFISVTIAAMVLCFLASLYPSRKAAKLNPIESIRWE